MPRRGVEDIGRQSETTPRPAIDHSMQFKGRTVKADAESGGNKRADAEQYHGPGEERQRLLPSRKSAALQTANTT